MTDNDFRRAVDQIKSRVDILDVIGSRIDLNRQNKALCPFHEEKTPSFSVNAKGQYFRCFGCGESGDAIRFLELHGRMTFMEALASLAEKAGVALPQLDGAALETLKNQRSIEDVLTATAHHYHKQLPPEVMEYLSQERGFTKETMERFLIGWADGGLREYLMGERSFPLELCLQAGVLKRTDGDVVRDYFYKRIIFPNLCRGRVVHMTGRSSSDNGPKYLHLPGPMQYLFNEDALRNERVVLCEGAPDCIAAAQAGFPAAAILGTSQFNESHRDRFRKCKTVYLCLDGDEAGRRASQRVGRLIPDKAIVVALPDGKDINNYLPENTSSDFQRLLDEGKPYIDMEIDRIGRLPENIRNDEIKSMLPLLRQLDDFEREKYSAVIKREFKLNKKTIDIGIETGGHDDQSSSTDDETAPPAPAITEEERQQAILLLSDPDLIKNLLATVARLECVGEEDNILMIYLTLLSRILDKPISLIVKGESSGGKSYLVESVSRLFPESEVMKFTVVTARALFHRPDDLAHKALVVFEQPGTQDSDYAFRSLQSEGKLTISLPVKDEQTGVFNTQDKTVMGPVAMIVTTTEPHLHPENETRCFELFIDESQDQTERILAHQRLRCTGRRPTHETDVRPWIVAQALLTKRPVIIPYVDRIKFPSKVLRSRRDQPRFLAIIETSTILHQFQREKVDIDGIEHIIATVEDYAVAFGLGSTILQQILKSITPKAEELIRAVHAHLASSDITARLTRTQIGEAVGWNRKTVARFLSELVDQGLLEIVGGGKGTAFEYRFVRLPDDSDNLLIHPSKLEKLLQEEELSYHGTPTQTANGQVKTLPQRDSADLVQEVQP